MIAAGTSPPRVMQTIARHWPLTPASRQASARASRWNWSHDTGKAFSGRDIVAHSVEAPSGAGMRAELDGKPWRCARPPPASTVAGAVPRTVALARLSAT